MYGLPVNFGIGLNEMKVLIYTLFLLGSVGVMPIWSESAGSFYETYWLTNRASGEYVKLVLTRRTLSDLPGFSPAADQPVSDCDAVIVTTYARDSVWNVDQRPFKPLVGVERVETNSIVINGERFIYTQARLEEVVRLLRDPMGTIPIHRIYGPLAGQEQPVRIIVEKLQRQLADAQKRKDQQDGSANGSLPLSSETN